VPPPSAVVRIFFFAHLKYRATPRLRPPLPTPFMSLDMNIVFPVVAQGNHPRDCIYAPPRANVMFRRWGRSPCSHGSKIFRGQAPRFFVVSVRSKFCWFFSRIYFVEVTLFIFYQSSSWTRFNGAPFSLCLIRVSVIALSAVRMGRSRSPWRTTGSITATQSLTFPV